MRWLSEDVYLASWPLRRTETDRRFVYLAGWPLRGTEEAARRFCLLGINVEVALWLSGDRR